MTQKIIVADDSQTIQKVVAITLANDSYELITCLNETDLVKQVALNSSALVLLDFNLSDTKDGYQMATELKREAPQISILAMMGTFDVVDESKMKSAGVDDHIAKPFDSNLFIQKCRSLTNKLEALDDDLDEEDEDEVDEEWQGDTEGEISFDTDSDDEVEEDENWVMDSSNVASEAQDSEDDSEEEDFLASEAQADTNEDELSSELAGWGIPVPGKIGLKGSLEAMPPVIGEEAAAVISLDEARGDDLEEGMSVDLSEDQTSLENEDELEEVELDEGEDLSAQAPAVIEDEAETTLPEEDDLEYPDMDIVGSSQDDLKNIKLSSSLVGVDELAPEGEEESSEDSQDEDKNNASVPSSLADEIASEDSPDDFWAADEVIEDSGADKAAKVGGAIANPDIAQSVDEHSVPLDIDALAPMESNLTLESTPAATRPRPAEEPVRAFDEEKLVAKIKDALAPMIEEMVKSQVEALLQERVDHIAWEVIPDLAENLIRDEIKNISSDL